MVNAALLGALLLQTAVSCLGHPPVLLQYDNCTYEDVYIPVCGSDNRNYYNNELLSCLGFQNPNSNLTMKYPYPCACHGLLNRDVMSPVCGNDKNTYPSEAALQCIKVITRKTELAINKKGVCEGGKVDECWTDTLPANLWAPVCGSDDLTYNSQWHLRCENSRTGHNVQVKETRACQCKVSRFFKPLCASNQVTYPNMQIFLCDQHLYNLHNVTIVREGYCEWSHDSPCENRVPQFDESISNGLCASNGITYLTAQQFKCVRSKNKGLKLLHDGPCKVSEMPQQMTPEEACEVEDKFPVVAPVCGSDGNSYMSLFSLLCTSINQTGLRLKSEGVCEKDKVHPAPSPCTITDTTVSLLCATNNVTYANPTHFACAASKTKGLLVLHPGVCTASDDICQTADDTASLNLPYVCASDNRTYLNLYAFWCIKLSKPGLEVAHFDECV